LAAWLVTAFQGSRKSLFMANPHWGTRGVSGVPLNGSGGRCLPVR
jgi:hypothetical protein